MISIVPPPDLPRGPTNLWWGVEITRVSIIWSGTLVWLAGILLIGLVKDSRRQIAPICLAAAIACMVAASLALDFSSHIIAHPISIRPPVIPGLFVGDPWAANILNYPAFFDAGGLMAMVAIVLWVIPLRKVAAGHCVSCGYDLTGNQSGRCPECGTETPRYARQTRLNNQTEAADRLDDLLRQETPADAVAPDADALEYQDSTELAEVRADTARL
jgi:predicted RNA-binding Zn-ribbon protein involved in translation (DUF1610 family)